MAIRDLIDELKEAIQNRKAQWSAFTGYPDKDKGPLGAQDRHKMKPRQTSEYEK